MRIEWLHRVGQTYLDSHLPLTAGVVACSGLALAELALHHRHGEAVEATRPDEAFVP